MPDWVDMKNCPLQKSSFLSKKKFSFFHFFLDFFLFIFFFPTILQRISTQGVVLRPFFADIPVFEYDDHSFASQKSYRSWKKKFPKDMSKDEQCPAVRKWAQKYRFFQSCPKSLKNWLQGYFLPKFSFLRSKKFKIVVLMVEILSNYEVLYFEKLDFFIFFGCFRPPAAKKSDFSEKGQTDPKSLFRVIFSRNLRF